MAFPRLSALRAPWTLRSTLTRPHARRRWATCATWAEAQDLLSRVVSNHRRDAAEDLARLVPTCWPELVPAMMAVSPEATSALLSRSDCTVDVARRVLDALPRGSAPLPAWPLLWQYAVSTTLAARGWSLVVLDPPRWRALVDTLCADPGLLPNDVAWGLVLATPDVPLADWAALVRRPSSPQYGDSPAMFRRLLMDPRLSAADRRWLVTRSLRAMNACALPTILWEPLPWQYPGALAGILDVEAFRGAGASVRRTRFLAACWTALVDADPSARGAFWDAMAAADSDGRPVVVDALWQAHRDDLLAMEEALVPLLTLASATTRLEVLLATTSGPRADPSVAAPPRRLRR